MPWAGKFDEALKGCINKHRTLGRLLHYYGKDVREHTRGGAPNLFAKVEQGGLGIALPPGIEPGWTWYQRSLAHHLRHQLVERVNQSVTLGVDLNILVGLVPDFTFQPEIESPATPKPPAKASARWLRSYGRWRTNPVWQPCGQFEHRVKDLPADEPILLILPYNFHGSSLNHGGSTIVFRRPTWRRRERRKAGLLILRTFPGSSGGFAPPTKSSSEEHLLKVIAMRSWDGKKKQFTLSCCPASFHVATGIFHQDQWWLSCACALHFLATATRFTRMLSWCFTSTSYLFYPLPPMTPMFLSFLSVPPRYEYTLNSTSVKPADHHSVWPSRYRYIPNGTSAVYGVWGLYSSYLACPANSSIRNL